MVARTSRASAPKTEVAVVEQAGLPVNIDALFKQDVEDLRARLQKPSGDRIKISNKQFTLPGGTVFDFLDVVIVDAVYANRYYGSSYDKNTIVPPDCFATSPTESGLIPSPNSPELQNAGGCTGCPQNVFGSAIVGKGKACKNRMLLAVLPTDATLETPFSILDISPTAVKGFSSYANAVTTALGRPLYGVITHVECNPQLKEDVAVFSDPHKLENSDFILMLRSRLDEARQRLLVEPDVSAISAVNDSKSKSLQAPRRAGNASRRI